MDEKEKAQRLIGRLYSFLDEADSLWNALADTPEANLPPEARNSPSSAYEQLLLQLGDRGLIPEFPEDCTFKESIQTLIAELEAEYGVPEWTLIPGGTYHDLL